ncbi:hypothetical protein DHEL01_v212014 [Diaporthe helianthi]|uniref:Uncharacterized protein n=1 Tax=Diaporthe helianthi TaxID=158607 RepID=A0A2P5HH62_DIAHE|nr:hypothetical protein DHEL01_v212014 [Diaporthe helianthi]
MARDYWVESLPSGHQRFVKASLRRSHSNPHDASSQSSRGRRVDFLDVTREEYNLLLARDKDLSRDNEALRRENHALKANWRTCSDDLRRLQARLPSLETMVRNLEHENHELRSSFDHHHHHHRTSSYGEDAMRRLRNKNTKLMNENDSLLARVRSLERNMRDEVGNGTRKFMDEIAAWRRRYDKLSYTVHGLQNDLAVATDRNRRLEEACELRARNERKAMRDVDRYKATLRQHGLR